MKPRLPREHAALVGGVPGPLKAILGPSPCRACAQPVYLARSNTRLLGRTIPGMLLWRDRTGRVHGCHPLARPRSRARAMWDNVQDEYSVAMAHNAQRPVVRLYSERRGVDVPEYRRNA